MAGAPMLEWLRQLFQRLPRQGQPAASTREADWIARSAVPTEADETARLHAEEIRNSDRPDTT